MAQGPTALFVHADTEQLREPVARLEAHGLTVVRSGSLHDASHLLDEFVPALAVIALDLPDGDALDLLNHPALDSTRVIVVGDHIDGERARLAIARGAGYVFSGSAGHLLLNDLLDDLAEELLELSTDPRSFIRSHPVGQLGLLHGSAPVMDKLYRVMRKLGPSDAHVLLCGESGSGKHLAARTIHQLSDRSHGPFISVNCAAAPSNEMEALLFGSEAQADGEDANSGLSRALGGTLLLEEITDLTTELQLKLLRLLESSENIERTSVDLRLIATTSRHPDEIPERLRQDLRYRIASAPVVIPPLRARTEDIDGLACLFLRELNERAGTTKFLSRDALAVLKSYRWPGNVRELRSVIEQAFIMAEQQINPEHLPDLQRQPVRDGDVLQLTIGDSVQEAEKKLTLATLSYYKGDKRKAAQTLGVSLKTLYNRINAYRADQQSSSMNVAE